MWSLGPLAFTSPLLLLGLVALPVLWLILRAVPPAPIRRRFPGVALLLGLADDEMQADRTPWWLLLLRLLAAAAVIVAFAGPILNPAERRAGTGPLLILADATWADARDWPARIARMEALLLEAGRDGRPAAILPLTDPPPDGPVFRDAAAVALTLPALAPRAWSPTPEAMAAVAASLPQTGFETVWLSDGLAREGREGLLDALRARGAVSVVQTPRTLVGLQPAVYADGAVRLTAVRTPSGPEAEVTVQAIGPDPGGVERPLAAETVAFPPGAGSAEIAFDLPPELRNRVSRFEIAGARAAGAVTLADDSLQRREIVLIAGSGVAEALTLLSPLHYLRQALAPGADLIEGIGVAEAVRAGPDVIILADVARLAEGEDAALTDWVEAGGLLIRFAGPRLAAAERQPGVDDPLLPVRLRSGGRSVGGTMSWGEPKALAPFAETSPFVGLAVPPDVSVRAQVVAEPDPTLAERVIAQLQDGTPLVTRAALGSGQVVLFHVTANAEWSNLPLSGLFVQMLERLAVSSRPLDAEVGDLAGTTWRAEALLDAEGRLAPVDTLAGVPGERIAAGGPGPDLPPGLYGGEDRRLAVNVLGPGAVLAPAAWPADVPVEGLEALRELPLKGWLIGAALILLALDLVASLALSGRLPGPGRRGPAPAALLAAVTLALALLLPGQVRAQDAAAPADLAGGAPQTDPEFEAFARAATSEVVLAHVLTGDSRVDEVAEAGLRGLSRVLFQRTAVEPAEPMGIDIETDELAFFPLLYWPITAETPVPSPAAYERLNRYLRTGGMILFDTRDADLAGFGASTPEGRRLQAIAALLEIPPLEPMPPDHVLTRTFYLLQEFPGRFAGPEVWVEAAPPDAELADGMPFRNLNDGVTPVVIGGNDWAGAWAVDEWGAPLLPVGRGMAGERQREIALRFGVNLVMHVLTGNYKSDQVHVPALLERLGQ